jgi:hypothetical protein
MLKASLLRYAGCPSYTRGALFIGGEVLYTLERPWKDNARNVSCIPAGKYQAVFIKSSASGKYRDVWHILAVPDRGGILVHNGNLVEHTKGCILVGLRPGKLGGAAAVLSSMSALVKLRELSARGPFELNIFGEH